MCVAETEVEGNGLPEMGYDKCEFEGLDPAAPGIRGAPTWMSVPERMCHNSRASSHSSLIRVRVFAAETGNRIPDIQMVICRLIELLAWTGKASTADPQRRGRRSGRCTGQAGATKL